MSRPPETLPADSVALYRRLLGFVRPHPGVFTVAVLCMAIVAGTGGAGFQRPTGEQQSQSAIDLDKIAPIPARPGLYPPGSTVYVGKVTFEVKLKGVVPAAAGAAEGQ